MTILRNTNITGSREAYVPGLSEAARASGSTNGVEQPARPHQKQQKLQQSKTDGLKSADTTEQVPPKVTLTRQEIEQALAHLSPDEVKGLLSSHFSGELEILKEDTQNAALAKAEQELEHQKQLLEQDRDAQQIEFQERQSDLTQAIDFWLEKVADEASHSGTETFTPDLFMQLLFKAVTQVTSIELTDKQYISSLIKRLSEDYKQESACRLLVSEYHHQQITHYLEKQSKALPWQILVDPDLLPGSYRLEFNKGSLELDLEHSLSHLKESLLSLSVLEGEQGA